MVKAHGGGAGFTQCETWRVKIFMMMMMIIFL
jgi:hypothetical protein